MLRITKLIATFIFLITTQAEAVPAKGHRIMVAGPSPDSITIAKSIHQKGGNVIDAAVAVALGLAVTHPYYAAFGGGGFAVLKVGSTVEALDFREMAPAATNPATYKDKPGKASLDGGLAVGVPGVAAGLFDLHKKHGKLKWPQVVAPAIQLAEKGFQVSGEWVDLTKRNQKRFSESARKTFPVLKPGDTLKQPKLAKFLRSLSTRGKDAFYKGDGAKDVIAAVNATGGVFTTEDLANYKTRWLKPLTTSFRGHTLHLMPPPSSGGVVMAQAFPLIEKLAVTNTAPFSVDEYHLLAEVQKQAFRGRVQLGDPDFAKNPVDAMTTGEALDKLAKQIKIERAAKSETFLTPEERESLRKAEGEKEQTTHFSVMDANGNAVALTVTLNGDYGSGVVTEKFGIALNNEMDDFTTKPGVPNMFGLIQGEANSVRAGARPLSSMSPTLVEKDGKIVLAVGAPGGPRIITGVMQAIYRVLARELDVETAIQSARVHHQFLPDVVKTDLNKLPPESLNGLRHKGHVVEFGSTAKVYAIQLSEDGILSGAADARGEGAAGGY